MEILLLLFSVIATTAAAFAPSPRCCWSTGPVSTHAAARRCGRVEVKLWTSSPGGEDNASYHEEAKLTPHEKYVEKLLADPAKDMVWTTEDFVGTQSFLGRNAKIKKRRAEIAERFQRLELEGGSGPHDPIVQGFHPPGQLHLEGVHTTHQPSLLDWFWSGEDGRGPELKDVTLHITSPGPTLVLGEARSGKSKLLRVIGGEERASAGAVTVDTPVLGYTNRKAILVIPIKDDDGRGFDIHKQLYLSIRDVLKRNRSPLCDPSVKPALVHQLLGMSGLMKCANKRGTGLSGSETAKMAIAVALARGAACPLPPILVLDHLTHGMDRRCREKVDLVLENLAKRYGVKLVMCTHELESLYLAEDVVEMEQGHIKDGLETPLPKDKSSLLSRMTLQVLEKRMKEH